MSEFVVREVLEADKPLIISSWLTSYYNSDHAQGLMRDKRLRMYAKLIDSQATIPNIYYGLHRLLVNQLLRTNQVLVACWEDDPNVVVGWICFGRVAETTFLHYVYVKPAFQQGGIAKLLMKQLPDTENHTITHLTPSAQSVLDLQKWAYQPKAVSQFI